MTRMTISTPHFINVYVYFCVYATLAFWYYLLPQPSLHSPPSRSNIYIYNLSSILYAPFLPHQPMST
jgi:hypothetical protein